MLPIETPSDAAAALADGGVLRAVLGATPGIRGAAVDPVPIGDPDEDEGYEDDDEGEDGDEDDDDEEEPLQCRSGRTLRARSPPGGVISSSMAA